MKEKSPAVQWYPKQALGDDKIIAMDWDAKGMHYTLCWLSWQQEPPGTIPDETALIRRWLGSPSDDEWRRVSPQVYAAWPIADVKTHPEDQKVWGRRVNAGMYRAWCRQQIYKQNGSKARANPNQQLEDEEEDLNSKKTLKGKSVREIPPESDVSVKKIAQAHPKLAKPFETERAIVEQLDRLGDKMGVLNAQKYLLEQTLKYRTAFEKWPKDRQNFSPESPRWFASGCYQESETMWEQKAQESPVIDAQGGHFEGTVYVTKGGKRLPGYRPPPMAKGTGV